MTAHELRDKKITVEEAAGKLAAFDTASMLANETSVKRILRPVLEYMENQAKADTKPKRTRSKKTDTSQ